MNSSPHLPAITDPDATQAQLAVLEPLRRPDSTVLNIFRTMVNHPDLTRRWLVFGNHVLAKSTLSERVRELAILRVGWRCGSEYEWGQGVHIARGCGVLDEEISQLMSDEIGPEWAPADAAALVAADELHHGHKVSDATWQQLQDHYSVEQCMDLVFAVGQYTLVSMALNTLRSNATTASPASTGEHLSPDPGPPPSRAHPTERLCRHRHGQGAAALDHGARGGPVLPGREGQSRLVYPPRRRSVT